MKALSLWQPWASLVALGHKKIETRTWKTSYRGPLYIHAAKKWVGGPCLGWPNTSIREAFRGIVLLPKDLPRGAILCRVDLVDCIETHPLTWPYPPELYFGDYRPGNYMWMLDNLKTFEPVSYRGRQRLFNVPDNIKIRLDS